LIVIIPLAIIVGVLCWVLRPGKKPGASRMIAILVTVILSSSVAIAAVVFQLLHNASGTVEVSGISNTCFVVNLSLIGAYLLTLAGFGVVRKWDIAKGIGFGICIAVEVAIVELGLLEWLGGV
jgi:hypothetical protein